MFENIRKFLWQGGKSNIKKFHLVKWLIINTPKLRGGLGITYPSLVNRVIGENLVCRLISHSDD